MPKKAGRGMPPRRPWSPPVSDTQDKIVLWISIWNASVTKAK